MGKDDKRVKYLTAFDIQKRTGLPISTIRSRRLYSTRYTRWGFEIVKNRWVVSEENFFKKWFDKNGKPIVLNVPKPRSD